MLRTGARTVSTTIIGTLVEIRDTFLVLDGNTHIMLPPGRKVADLVVVTRKSGQRTAERIERSPV